MEEQRSQEETELSNMKEVDYFSHKIEMPTWMWLRTGIFTIVLLPLRVVTLFILVFLTWLVASIGMFGLSEDERTHVPISGWRRQLQTVSMWLGRFAFFATGFINVRVKGERALRNVAPILVAAPHSTFFDGFAIFFSDLPYIVSRDENKKIPFIGKCIEFTQAISVKREDPNSRKATVDEIKRRASNSEGNWRQIMMFPEGSCSNRKALMAFKPGAFYPGTPIQPVLIRYPNKTDTITWTWKQSHGARLIAWLTLTQAYNTAELEYLPVYYPSKQEIDDPILYARNVQNLMAQKLGVPTSDLTFEQIKEKFGKFYKKKKMQ